LRFAGVAAVDGTGGDAGSAGYFGDPGLLVAFFGEEFSGGAKKAMANVVTSSIGIFMEGNIQWCVKSHEPIITVII
jgi:hypothetical protein